MSTISRILDENPWLYLFVLVILWTLPPNVVEAKDGKFPEFTVHEMGEHGRKQGQTSLSDIDRDGDLDFVSGNRNGEIRWWEYRGPDDWVRHVIAPDKAPTDVGGFTMDVDGDGWIDQISGSAWYRNPGNPKEKTFERYDFGGEPTHDQLRADLNGDGKPDVVSLFDNTFCWYEIPDDPASKWPRHEIGPGLHAGLAIGDLDGDGDQDVVRGDLWFENTSGNGIDWTKHPLSSEAPTGTGTISAVDDLDGDGDPDVAQVGHDGSTVSWIETRKNGAKMVEHVLYKDMNKSHSIQIADFNNDGRPDIYAGDTVGNAYIWENEGNGKFTRHRIAKNVPGHETVAGDVDGDGDVDLCSKPWNGGRHVFLRNTLSDKEKDR